jgi:hypothetical protein
VRNAANDALLSTFVSTVPTLAPVACHATTADNSSELTRLMTDLLYDASMTRDSLMEPLCGRPGTGLRKTRAGITSRADHRITASTHRLP